MLPPHYFESRPVRIEICQKPERLDLFSFRLRLWYEYSIRATPGHKGEPLYETTHSVACPDDSRPTCGDSRNR
jgi:hypothetical protein